ncbi:hypothetical protein [Poritiphilus flavus]|uniref:LTXXQ motif family protein n=1 Tax=Poritiphilus flavus TaxID=2697053 RepID=A0A6L9E9C6_9FLAO|nr:hypothetical protein [Poritiphilus flavus]NAS11224.1 hypothetical protein [Poritiphilus flavus]
MKNTFYISILLVLFCGYISHAQRFEDCTLGLGGKDAQTIVEVFQLNEEQQSKMNAWSAELQTQQKLIEDQIQELFDKHPQSTTEELNTLAVKYKKLKDQIVTISKSFDQKLLATFNERQYERYVALCRAAYRQPMTIPQKVRDSVNPE